MSGATIGDRWRSVRDAVVAACARAGRDPRGITIVAVSKKHPASAIEEAYAAGVTDVGENYAQELVDKAGQVRSPVRWHFIGRLQRNKVRLVLGSVLIHAVDSPRLAEEIERRAAEAGMVQAVLVEVNVAGEDTKGGVAAAHAGMLVSALAGMPHVRCDGLMTMPPPPPAGAPEASRPYFAALRELRDELATHERPLPVLSMGMSADFEAAVIEGATHLRVGTAIFGPRPR